MARKRKAAKKKWGKSGKVYRTKKEAEKQGRAIYASGYRKNGKK